MGCYSFQARLREFHKACGLALDEYQPSRDLLQLRKRLILEETKEVGDELSEALRIGRLNDETRLKLAKELADLQYVVTGAAVSFGINLDEAFDAVHESNMSKLVDGKAVKDEGGKVQKGPNYHPPNEVLLALAAGVAIDVDGEDAA
jgi:predicted HAD superfamily Cof-like phosphohydrolase